MGVAWFNSPAFTQPITTIALQGLRLTLRCTISFLSIRRKKKAGEQFNWYAFDFWTPYCALQ
jgi:hypothetical protein